MIEFMKSVSIYVFLAIGTGLMLMVTVPLARRLKLPKIRTVIFTVLLALVGLAGALLMGVAEGNAWGARSFFGALFLPLLVMPPVALLLRYPCGKMLDLCAPAECVMLALLKLKCYADGCCYGREITLFSRTFVFPSQLTELAAALILMAVLIKLILSGLQEGSVYPWYMILYGVSRFFLNLLRDTTPFVWILPAGNFWSIVSLILGILALWILKRKSCAAQNPAHARS